MIRRMWDVKKVDIVLVVVGVLGSVTNKLNSGFGLELVCYRKLC